MTNKTVQSAARDPARPATIAAMSVIKSTIRFS
jgi:hypothetical protein